MSALRVNDLLTDARLDAIEGTIRREFPSLSDGVIFNTYVQPEGYAAHPAGVEVPVPAMAVLTILVPNPKWPEKLPQYRAVNAPRSLMHFQHFEKQRDRIVDAPDVPLMDFRAAARKAVEIDTYYRSLLN